MLKLIQSITKRLFNQAASSLTNVFSVEKFEAISTSALTVAGQKLSVELFQFLIFLWRTVMKTTL